MSWFAVAIWGGLVGLDATSFPQFMFSRPIVAGPVTGLIFGRPLEGLVIGAALELYALAVLPIGAARTPETGTAAVAGVAAYAAAAPAGVLPGPFIATLAFAIAWARVGGTSVHLLRRLNARIAPGGWLGSGSPALALERRHLAALGLDFVRGAVVALAGAPIGFVLIRVVGSGWGLSAEHTFGLLAIVLAGLIGAALPLLGGWRRHGVAFVIGIACGLILLLAA